MNPPDLLFGKFRTLNCLKKDENGSVWLAHHFYLDQPVILKILHPGMGTDPAMVERFQREARLLARLRHPHIIRVLDFSVVESDFYISFEYFSGLSLRQRLKAGDLDLAQKSVIMAQVTAALAAAHAQQIIHRDVKPENILINAAGEVKLADFGLAMTAEGATITQKSAVVGTPAYMSPEQLRGEALSPVSDLFSLGIVAHELFYGRHPFIDREVTRTINNILAGDEVVLPPEPALPEGLAGLIAALLRKRRDERSNSAAAVQQQLENIFPELQLSPREQSGVVPPRSKVLDMLPPQSKADDMLPPRMHADGAAPSRKQVRAKPPQPTTDEVSPPGGRAARPSVRSKRGWVWTGVLALATAGVILLLGRPLSLEWLEERRGAAAVAQKPGNAGRELLQPEGTDAMVKERITAESAPPRLANQGAEGGPAAAQGQDEEANSGGQEPAPGLTGGVETAQAGLVPAENGAAGAAAADSAARRHIEAAGEGDGAAGLDKIPGLLYITCEPWAEIFIDSVRIDVTPLQEPLRLFPGSHELRLRHPDYPEYRQILQIAPRQPLRVAVDLDALCGWLELRIHPWAEVRIDSVSRGQTPLARPLALEPGGHRLQLRHPDFGEVEDFVAIVRGETTRFEINMTRLAGRQE